MLHCRLSVFGKLLLCLLLLAGCGGLKRVPVAGEVSLDGVPLPTGTINFVPIGDGISVGAEIVDGTFHLSDQTGPVAGEYRLEITSTQPSGKKIKDTDGVTERDEIVNVIPAKYNSSSELKATIPSDETLNLELKSK